MGGDNTRFACLDEDEDETGLIDFVTLTDCLTS